MHYVFFIFAFGVMVSLLIAKGVMMANEYTGEELERMEREKLPEDRKD